MKKITVFDIFCIIFVACFCIFWTIKSINNITQSSTLHIDTHDSSYEYNLDKNQTIEVQGSNGTTVIEIKDKSFRFVSSECQNDTCINYGFVKIAGFPIVCLPNRVSAYIVGNNEEFDDISH